MGLIYDSIFSEFEITRLGIKLDGENTFTAANCVATFKEEMETKTVTKKCRGKVKKTRTKGTGNGTIEASLHIPYALLVKFKGMQDDTLADGIYAYGENSRHKGFIATCKIEDEDGNVKLKAYPNCIIQNGIPNDIENESTEVKESEISIVVMPDDRGYGVYEKIVPIDTPNADVIIEDWLTNWSYDMVTSTGATYTVTWNLTNCTVTNAVTSVDSGYKLEAYVKPDEDYILPDTITVSGSTNYYYGDVSGLILIDGVSANTTITISADEV